VTYFHCHCSECSPPLPRCLLVFSLPFASLISQRSVHDFPSLWVSECARPLYSQSLPCISQPFTSSRLRSFSQFPLALTLLPRSAACFPRVQRSHSLRWRNITSRSFPCRFFERVFAAPRTVLFSLMIVFSVAASPIPLSSFLRARSSGARPL